MNNSERLLKYLKSRKSATSAQIYAATGIWRVSSAVLYARNKVKIITTMIETKNRHGETVRVASYSLK